MMRWRFEEYMCGDVVGVVIICLWCWWCRIFLNTLYYFIIFDSRQLAEVQCHTDDEDDDVEDDDVDDEEVAM